MNAQARYTNTEADPEDEWITRGNMPSTAPLITMRVFAEGGSQPWCTLFNAYTEQLVCCQDLADAVIKMNKIYDELAFPQAAMQIRKFEDDGKKKTSDPFRLVQPKRFWQHHEGGAFSHALPCRATFQIQTRFRQNASWQGSVTWQEKGFCRDFRSALELMHLLTEALSRGAR